LLDLKRTPVGKLTGVFYLYTYYICYSMKIT